LDGKRRQSVHSSTKLYGRRKPVEKGRCFSKEGGGGSITDKTPVHDDEGGKRGVFAVVD